MFPFTKKSNQSVIKIAHVPVVQALPLHLAMRKGYFSDLGLKVEAVEFHSPNQVRDALLSGHINFGAFSVAADVVLISQAANPGSLKIFALIGGSRSNINDMFLIRRNDLVQSVSDLKGKKLGILTGTQFRVLAQHILAQHNLIVGQDVKIVELAVPFQVQALVSGFIDALLTIEPVGTLAKSTGLVTDLIKSPMVEYISDPWYGSLGLINAQFIKHNPKLTPKILSIFDQAIQDIQHNPNQAKQHLPCYRLLDPESDNCNCRLQEQTPLPVYKMYHQFDQGDLDAMQKYFDIFLEHKVISQRINIYDVIYHQ